MSTLQEQARALGDPMRYAIYRYAAMAQQGFDVDRLVAKDPRRANRRLQKRGPEPSSVPLGQHR